MGNMHMSNTELKSTVQERECLEKSYREVNAIQCMPTVSAV